MTSPKMEYEGKTFKLVPETAGCDGCAFRDNSMWMGCVTQGKGPQPCYSYGSERGTTGIWLEEGVEA